MSTGSALYLILCVMAFTTFGAVLGYYTWQQSKLGRDYVTPTANSPAAPEPMHAESAGSGVHAARDHGDASFKAGSPEA